MAYQRKTKDVWVLIWNGEEIDSFDDRAEAKRCRAEYELAYHDCVSMEVRREKL